MHVFAWDCTFTGKRGIRANKGPGCGQMRLAEAGIRCRMADVQLIFLASLATSYQVWDLKY